MSFMSSTVFTRKDIFLSKQSKNVDLSYKTDLDLSDCLEEKSSALS